MSRPAAHIHTIDTTLIVPLDTTCACESTEIAGTGEIPIVHHVLPLKIEVEMVMGSRQCFHISIRGSQCCAASCGETAVEASVGLVDGRQEEWPCLASRSQAANESATFTAKITARRFVRGERGTAASPAARKSCRGRLPDDIIYISRSTRPQHRASGS